MHIEDTQNKFVELRAQGWSLGHIATELHVSKRTLVEWNREFADDIQSFRAAEQELVREKFLSSREEELNRLARLQKDVEDELANRPLKFIPIEKLFRLSMDLRHEIQALQMDLGEDTEISHPHCGRQNGNGPDRTRSVNRRRAAQTTHVALAEDPSDSVDAITSDLPPAPPNAENPGRNGVHAGKPVGTTSMASAPAELANNTTAVAAMPETPHSSSERNGESSDQSRQRPTSPGCPSTLLPLDPKSTLPRVSPALTSAIQKPGSPLGHFCAKVVGRISSLLSQPLSVGKRSSCPTPRRSRRTTRPNTTPL
jgi:hypothetical protein